MYGPNWSIFDGPEETGAAEKDVWKPGDLLVIFYIYSLDQLVVLVSEKLQLPTKKRSVWILPQVKNPGPAKMLEEVKGCVE